MIPERDDKVNTQTVHERLYVGSRWPKGQKLRLKLRPLPKADSSGRVKMHPRGFKIKSKETSGMEL